MPKRSVLTFFIPFALPIGRGAHFLTPPTSSQATHSKALNAFRGILVRQERRGSSVKKRETEGVGHVGCSQACILQFTHKGEDQKRTKTQVYRIKHSARWPHAEQDPSQQEGVAYNSRSGKW